MYDDGNRMYLMLLAVFCDFTTNKNKSAKLLDSLLHFLDVKWLKKLWNITSPHSVLELENECLQKISHIKSNGDS